MTQPPEFPPPASDPGDPSSTPPPPPPPPPPHPSPPATGPTDGPPAPYGQQPYSGQAYGQQPYYQQAEPGAGGMNGLAIAALVVGFFCWPLGFVFGGVALSQIKKKNQKGRGLAIAGIALSTLGLIGSIVYVATGGLDDAERDDKGTLTETGDISTLELRDGDCLNGFNAGTTMTSVEGVPCSEPHEGEVYAVIDLGDGDFPGDEAVSAQADEQCPQRLASEHPAAAKDSTVGVSFFVPTGPSWRLGDHVITCVTVTEEKRSGPLVD